MECQENSVIRTRSSLFINLLHRPVAVVAAASAAAVAVAVAAAPVVAVAAAPVVAAAAAA